MGTASGGSPVRRLHPRRGPGWAGVRFAVALPVVAACGAWVFGSRGWLVDLVAQAVAQAGLVAFVLAVWWVVRRRWLAGGFAVVGVAFAMVGVVSPGRVWVTSDAVDESAVVRVMVFNALASNSDEAGVRSAIVDADADVLALLEAPAWLVEELKVGGEWRERYPYYWVAAKAGAGFKVVMTKWPQVDPVSGQTGAWYAAVDGLRQVIVDRPDDRGGRFAFTLVHPASPRTRERWEAGNERLTTFIERVRAHIEPRGLPHLAGGDWNATPTGSRSRRVWSELGLRRAKPVLGLTGTWPASSVWPAQLAIDDVVVPAGARVVSWEAVGGTGSDHLAVVVGVEVR
jgi:endonuclease/exonuclease/phosphatase (EEP) superfamily protein YafD